MAYLIQKQFTFKGKTFFKDRTLVSADINEKDIERLVLGGYIKSTYVTLTSYKEPTAYKENEILLSPVEVNKMSKPELLNYADHIGVEGVDAFLKPSELKKIINNFIEIALENEKDEYDGDEVNA